MFEHIYDIEKCIRLKPINRTDEEAADVVNSVNTTIYSAKNDVTWHYIEGKYYRFKFFKRFYSILNELIGPKIANKLDLKTVNNFPAIMDYGEFLTFYGIISENFVDPNKEYLTIFDIGFKQKTQPSYKNIRRLKKYCNEEDYHDLINNLFKMTCLDYLMGQVDRVSSNFLFEKDGDKITFAPLFDYAEAYECAKMGCFFNPKENQQHNFSIGNTFIAPSFWEPKFKRELKKYPQFREYLEKIREINILEIIKEIEEEHNLKINDEFKRYYDVRTQEKQRSLVI
ncbi:MAG: hypothetical protein PHW32_03990 [Bacilli bacterium]|nr:hypothetical protein [Bacilli bacterium]MDD4282798.1 hypothetical protein [Bacilli bacterium]MDD4719157.1 hypothetical protein [Bacilli bacterium]